MSWRSRLEPFIRPFFQAYSRRSRGMTLGVRGLVLDAEGRVLLVRHTYLPGWHMPGGGVERGETTVQAMTRELAEEAGVAAIAPPALVSIHSAERHFRGDHVLLYRVTSWAPCQATSHGEIAEIGWFAPGALPSEVTEATRLRIAEALEGVAPHPHW